MARSVGARRHITVLVAAAAIVAGCGGSSRIASTPTRTVTDASVAPVKPSRPAVPTGPHDAPVPILMYHVVAAAPPGTPYPELWVPPTEFAADIAALAHAGYHATTLDTVWRAWHGHGAMPRHPIVLTFDDGYQSQSTNARRMLARRGWPGVLYLQVDNVRLPGGIHRSQVRAMMRDGWEIDAHTFTHPDLTVVGAARLHAEISGSRAWLQKAFGVPVNFFAYPAGRYDATVEAEVKAAGFHGATTTAAGIASPGQDPYALPRVRVTPGMTPSQLLGALRGLKHT
jgi:peptidoglycan/xylan/chitin deacetylase (PgdA/CDA1 family)